jgi:hypothetical protein
MKVVDFWGSWFTSWKVVQDGELGCGLSEYGNVR